MTSVREFLEREQFFDAAVLRHGFTDYMRDYEIIVGARDGPPHTDLHRYHFVGTVSACCRTALRGELFAMSLPDEFVLSGPDYPEIDDPAGYIWGVRFSDAYPGLEYVEDSELAERWTARLGCEMHEVLLETNAFELRLVFADLRYEYLGRADHHARWPRDYPIGTPAEKRVDGGSGSAA